MKPIIYLFSIAALIVGSANISLAQYYGQYDYGQYGGYGRGYAPHGYVEETIRQYYHEYLGREPRPNALYRWADHVHNVGSLRAARVGILSSQEYYLLARNDPSNFVQALFRDVVGQLADRREVNRWVGIFLDVYRGDREAFVREFLANFGQ